MKNIHCFPTSLQMWIAALHFNLFFFSLGLFSVSKWIHCIHHFWPALQPLRTCWRASLLELHYHNLKSFCEREGSCIYLWYLIWQSRLLLEKQLILAIFDTWRLKWEKWGRQDQVGKWETVILDHWTRYKFHEDFGGKKKTKKQKAGGNLLRIQ